MPSEAAEQAIAAIRPRPSNSAACGCGRRPDATSSTSSSASRWQPAVAQGHAAADAVESAARAGAAGERTSSSTSSRPPTRSRCGSGLTRPRSACHACGRSTTSSCSKSTGAGVVSLHLKLPGELTLEDAHEVASEVERAIRAAVPEVDAVQTHLEPLAEDGAGGRRPPTTWPAGARRCGALSSPPPARRRGSCASSRRPGGWSRSCTLGARPGRAALGGACPGERGRGADPARAARDRQRHRPHGAVSA